MEAQKKVIHSLELEHIEEWFVNRQLLIYYNCLENFLKIWIHGHKLHSNSIDSGGVEGLNSGLKKKTQTTFDDPSEHPELRPSLLNHLLTWRRKRGLLLTTGSDLTWSSLIPLDLCPWLCPWEWWGFPLHLWSRRKVLKTRSWWDCLGMLTISYPKPKADGELWRNSYSSWVAKGDKMSKN